MGETPLTQLRQRIATREARLRSVEHRLLLVEDDGEAAALMSEEDTLHHLLAADQAAYDNVWFETALKGVGCE